jgi:hypothetical protein
MITGRNVRLSSIHNGLQYSIVQTANPAGWKWTCGLMSGAPKRELPQTELRYSVRGDCHR